MILIGAFTIANALFHSPLKITSDGVWDSEEVEAIYGVHHVYSQKKSKVSYIGRALGRVFIDVLCIGRRRAPAEGQVNR